MTLAEQKKKLLSIYCAFEEAVGEMKALAVCEKGCNFCCTRMGNIDMTTLEGLVILEKLGSMSGDLGEELRGKIGRNILEKERGLTPPCPFQGSGGLCHIYDVRPFSCRQLYSLRKCDGRGPLIHRQAVDRTKETVRELQSLDENGYSGHISFVLHLLGLADFLNLYVAGGFDPTAIADFGKTHGIIIHRSICDRR